MAGQAFVFLAGEVMILRSYQQASVDAAWQFMRVSVSPFCIEAATGAGNSGLASDFGLSLSVACNACNGGSSSGDIWPSRVSTRGLDSICPAWLSVMPVKAKSSMPIRQIAELIQCHSCNFFSQYARCELPETADFMENLGWTCAAMEGVRHSAIGWKHSRSDDAQMRITFIYFTKAKHDFPWSRRVPSL